MASKVEMALYLLILKKEEKTKFHFLQKRGKWFDNFYDLMNTPDFLTSLQLAKKSIRSSLYNSYPKITDNPSNDNWKKKYSVQVFRRNTNYSIGYG